MIRCWGYGRKPSTALLMSLAARCGLRGLNVRGLGPATVVEVNTNMQPPPIHQLIDNLTSSCHCLLDDLRRLPDMPSRCGLCVMLLSWQPFFLHVLGTFIRPHTVMVSRQSYIVCQDLWFYLWTLRFIT